MAECMTQNKDLPGSINNRTSSNRTPSKGGGVLMVHLGAYSYWQTANRCKFTQHTCMPHSSKMTWTAQLMRLLLMATV
jgi:hypothetical protein